MGRDRIYAVIAAACTVAAAMLLLNLCLVIANAGTAAAYGEELPDACEPHFEPPAPPEPEQPAEPDEPQYEEPYVEPAYVEPEPVYVEPEPTYYEPAYAEPAPAYAPTDGLTKEGGVNYHDGRTETYYSSNVLYHYRTPEWTLDEEGFYHDAEGRYVVAASDMEQGTVFEGSKGECVVLDCGCDAGVTDYYVNWI